MKDATKAAKVRSTVGHPIIDADGHLVELGPVLEDELLAYLEEAGGRGLRDRYLAGMVKPFDTSTALSDRNDPRVREKWLAMPSWWGWQTRNTLDRATAHLPRLLYERLDEMGIELTLLYPSTVLALLDLDDVELGAALARGANRWLARIFRPYRDRIAVGGIVPMSNPQTAIAELEYAVTELGMKTVVMTGYARRPIAGNQFRLDTFGLDSEYDYDPLWAKCIELGVAPLSHSSHLHTRPSRSVSNYVYNHIGALAASHESLAKSLFLGGVTRRFPGLRFGFLEGGVAWAASLYADLLGHWSKRNCVNILELDPDRLDVNELMDYMERYGDDAVQSRLGPIRRFFSRPAARPEMLDEFARAEIRRAEDIRDLFVPNFYFGCEADDPLVAWAFAGRTNPLGARLRAMMGSDISHWDVPDMTEPVADAYGLVERGLITQDDFREFTFLNPVRLHAGMNPRLFEGTICEKAVAQALARGID
ncbi:MAG TPA: amidohydrolase family protein [Candidatus Binataceae bacterium]|jgi:predicted TIM-barrel fold metal-dependent hydrolase|nr:amidohydrolase family protein [Candidatus Binataceae bacterium]